MPQITRTIINMLIILAVSLGGGIALAVQDAGTAASWGHLAKTVNNGALHGMSLGICLAFGWLAMRSPWAKRAEELRAEPSQPEVTAKGEQ